MDVLLDSSKFPTEKRDGRGRTDSVGAAVLALMLLVACSESGSSTPSTSTSEGGADAAGLGSGGNTSGNTGTGGSSTAGTTSGDASSGGSGSGGASSGGTGGTTGPGGTGASTTEDGGVSEIRLCRLNSACTVDEYCEKAEAQCSEFGTCAPRDPACNKLLRPVCGCDDVTYDNACIAGSFGANVASSGACASSCELKPRESSCCFSDADCTGNDYCVDTPSCAVEGEGQCKAPTLPDNQCWQDSDCDASEQCDGASVCDCGANCLLPDEPGTCVAT